MLVLEGSTYVPPVCAWKYPVAVTTIAFVTDETLGSSSANTAWLGTVLTDSLYRYPLATDGSGFDFASDAGLNDRVDDNTAKGDVGESSKYVVGTGFGVVTSIVHAPDGLLYVSSISAGSVYRIGPAGTVGAHPSPVASGSTGAAPSGATVEITIGTDTGADLKFDPAELTVQAGADVRVTFENRASVPHNLTFQAPINVATSTVVAPGTSETVEFKAPAAGEYAFVCTLHPGMGGKLIVAGS